MKCANYRGITLLNIAYKIRTAILYRKLLPYVEKEIGHYQCGFRTGKSTIDQIFILKQILEKTNEFNINTHHLFIDFKAAYDSINRKQLILAMIQFNFPSKLIRLIRMTLEEVKCKVKIQNNLGNEFECNTGLRQGDALSCLLFNIALEKVVRDSELQREIEPYSPNPYSYLAMQMMWT